MKIQNKLFLMNLVAIAGFASITLGTIVSVNNLHSLNVLAREGLVLNSEFQVFVSRGMELSLTANLKDSFAKWTEQEKKFASLYEKFVGSPTFLAIPGSPKKIDEFAFVWKNAQVKITDISEKILELIDRNGGNSGEFISGLLQGYSRHGDVGFVMALSQVNSLSDSINTYAAPALSQLISLASGAAEAAEASLIRLIIILAVVVSAVSIFLFTNFGRKLSDRVVRYSSSMSSLEAKDFSIRLDEGGKDELSDIARAMNVFIGDFSRIIEDVKAAAVMASVQKDEVASAMTQSSASVTEMTANISSIGVRINDLVKNLEVSNRMVRGIAESVDSLLSKIETQSGLIERSTASIEEINASIGSVAGITAQRETAGRELVAVTQEGGSLISDTNQMIREIAGGIGEINEIVAIINGISDMTDLLSMNAAIEAAHAGNAGHGFAVVAEEIRKLADSTSENSKRIKATIDSISTKIEDVLQKSESSKAGFDEVAKEVDTTMQAMSEISTSMKELSSGSQEIMDATQELSGIAAEVSAEVSRIHTGTEGILGGIRNIEEIGEVVKQGMAEMEIGTREMDNAMASMSDLELKSSETIERLKQGVVDFKTATGEATQESPPVS